VSPRFDSSRRKGSRITWQDRGDRHELYDHWFSTPDFWPRSLVVRTQVVSYLVKIFALVADAFGGHGGIAKFNRDLLTAACTAPGVERVVALPRLLPEATGPLPDKLEFDTRGVGGKLRYALAVLKSACTHRRSAIVLCGHINLLPLACLVRWLLRPLASGRQPQLLLFIHGIDAWQPTRSALTNRLVREVDVIVAVSKVTGRRFVAWAGLPWERVIILPNSVDPSQFTPGAKDAVLLARYGLGGQTVLLTVGRLVSMERYKGFDQVLEVLPDLLREFPRLVYLVVGDGSDRLRLVAKAKSLGLTVSEYGKQKSDGREPSFSEASTPDCQPPHVTFAGRIPEHEKAAHYRLADAYVMPSRGEGFGIVYLEALACGVPVVGSKVDGSREALRDGRLGLLVDPDKPEEIKAAIRAALQKERGQVVDGLDFFSYATYQQRCHKLFTGLVRNP